MFKIARIRAPAKLNLHLEIGKRRPDGFHELISLFQSVSLADELEFRIRTGDGIDLHGDFPFPPEDNIILKAARLFFSETGVRSGLSVEVAKRIPMGGGLGGGSSDAAACLCALNALFDTGLDGEGLSRMGAKLGSDVPFFTRASCAIVRGRGELVEPIRGRDDLWVVIVDPLFGVSTQEAYRLFDEEGSGGGDRGFERSSADLTERYGAYPGEWGFFNSFFPLIAGIRPELGRIRTELAEDGALYSNMSGSGSSMFGIFDAEEAATAAAGRQRRKGLVAHQGFLLARSDNIILK